MTEDAAAAARRTAALAPLLGLGGVAAALHLATAGRYGHFIDELYLIDCSRNLDFGYVDMPPLAPFLVWTVRSAFGESLFALRAVPALAHAFTVVMVGLLASALGGARFAQILGAVAALFAPGFLRFGLVWVVPTLEIPLWALASYLAARALGEGRPAFWAAAGLVIGIGVANKVTSALFGVGLGLGVVLAAPHHLRNGGLWLGAAAAAACAAPYLAWQASHGWVTIEFVRAVHESRWVADTTLLDLFRGQIIYAHPLAAALWLPGLGFLLLARKASPYRALGILAAATFLLYAVLGSKVYYLLPLHVLLLPAGAVFWEGRIERRGCGLRTKGALLTAFVLAGIVLLPLGLPVLSTQAFQAFARIAAPPFLLAREDAPEFFRMYEIMKGERRRKTLEDLSRAFAGLSPEERRDAAILTGGYGDAGAVNFFGPRYGLPTAISGNLNYHLWGPRGHSGETVLAVGLAPDRLGRFFREIKNVPGTWIFLCRRPLRPLPEMWPDLKAYLHR